MFSLVALHSWRINSQGQESIFFIVKIYEYRISNSMHSYVTELLFMLMLILFSSNSQEWRNNSEFNRFNYIYLFFYDVFNNAFSNLDYIESNGRMIVNNELERMRKEAAVALFEVLSRHLPFTFPCRSWYNVRV
jgi:hypothetical protein